MIMFFSKIFRGKMVNKVYKFCPDIVLMQEEENFEIKNSRIDSLKSFFKTFFWLSKEEWTELDHKLFRIAFGVGAFIAIALFWLYFLRSVVPF